MTIMRDTTANFIGGVSQQTDKLMYPNQSKELINHLLDTVEGLKRRPPSKYIAKLCEPFSIHPYIHTIIKEDEEYEVILDGTDCQIFNLKGEKQELYISSKAQAYIQSQSPLTELYAITLADYTFILNKIKQVKLSDDKFINPYPYSALIFVKQGNYSTDYTITINGEQKAHITTSETSAADIKTNGIAQKLTQALMSSAGETFNIEQNGSTILLTNKNNEEFTISCEDSNGNRNLFAFYKTADTSTDLPVVAPNGFVLNIIQDAKDGADDYFVKFKTSDGSNFGQGTWSECPSPNIQYKLDDTTMPMGLVRQADGGFTLDVLKWGERLSGNEETAPNPSFINNTIQEIMTHKGRLGFVSVDKVIYSDVNDIFSFFKKSVLTELDTDPIDIASNSKMVLLKHTLPFNQELMLISETAQFILKGGDTFSNSTVSLDLVTSYQCSKDCKPVNLGANGYFIYENGSYTRVMSLFVTESLTVDAEDITEQCPSYLPSYVYKLAGSSANNTLLALSTSERDTLYVYNFYVKGNERGQSAWSKWKFENAKILNADFDKHLLYLTIQYADGVYLEVIDFTPKLKDFDLEFILYLDRKFITSSINYNEDTKESSFNLPYEVTDTNNFKVIDTKGFELRYRIEDNICYIKEKPQTIATGFVYKSLWQLPTIYVRQSNNNTIKVVEGTLMLRDINLAYANSGHFIVKVVPKYTTQMESEFKFTGKLGGLPSAAIGKTPIESGTFLIPIISRNEDIAIIIENNSYLPSCYLSMEWIGDFIQRGR